MRVILTHEETRERTRDSLRKASNVLRRVLDDPNLVTLFSYCLAVGNFLNGNTQRGDSWGFRLGDFDRIVDTKSNSNSRIINYIV